MRDDMNELVKFSPFGGQLILEDVSGLTSGNLNPENNVETKKGNDRNERRSSVVKDTDVFLPNSPELCFCGICCPKVCDCC